MPFRAIRNPNVPPAQNGFTADGDTTLPVTPGPFLEISDINPGTHLAFFAPENVTDGYTIKPRFNIDGNVPNRILELDSGVRVGFTDRTNAFYMGLLLLPGNIRQVAIIQDGGFSNGFQVDWMAPFD